uniref:Uncharacterized protein ycf23 n=1 Tax=Thaumatella adunca TaxID=2006976 RepID=A0A1Z1MNR2_9FLOR|nr:hypothetical protein [Thaumatella adunca]ARW67394.1 hypothetical protein [Thaumatella adunca]
MNLSNIKLYNSFKSKKVIKVITGIENTNISQIIKIAKASELSHVSYLDVAANTSIVKILKSFSSLPLCISSINPIDIYNCVSVGADLVEIGNYDFFYKQGIYFNTFQLINLVKEIKSFIGIIDICVTIPYHFHLNEQIYLAQALESLGVNILQTEGIFTPNQLKRSFILEKNIWNSIDLSNFSLLSTYVISCYVNIPIITSSSLISLSTPIAKFYGASGIGIGSTIRQKKTIFDMVTYINEVYSSLIAADSIQYSKKYISNDMTIKFSFFKKVLY